jgi:hypothetical protein
MAQVIAIQATVAQMNLSKRRNIGVPFPRAVTPDRSAEIRTRPQNQFSVPANLTKSHFLRLGQNRRLSGSLRRHAPLLLTRIARVDSLVSQLIRDLEGELKLAVRQVTVCLDDG